MIILQGYSPPVEGWEVKKIKSQDDFNNNGRGQNIFGWFDLLSHEIRHIPQIDRFGGLYGYLSATIKQYLMHLGHNSSLLEQEAETGSKIFENFDAFIDKQYGRGALDNLFKSRKNDMDKIITINDWWNAYSKQVMDEKMSSLKSLIRNYSNIESGTTYEWNGNQWVPVKK